MKSITVGLFGTCGGSKWRDEFKKEYLLHGISFYDPVVENWSPECAKEEAMHLATDDIILFPVTDETYGFGSLAETGFSAAAAIASLSSSKDRHVILMIAPKVNAKLQAENPVMAKESMKARTLANAHLAKIDTKFCNVVHSVSSLDEMLSLSVHISIALKNTLINK